MIEEALYRRIVQVLPIVCVDVILRASPEGYLLVRRSNQPRIQEWWVVGGRVLKGEKAVQAAARKAREEVGIEVDSAAFDFVGYCDSTYNQSVFGEGSYHTPSLVFEAYLPEAFEIRLDSQSSAWRLAEELPSDLEIIPPRTLRARPPAMSEGVQSDVVVE